jgi:hypothetical protein
MSGAFGIARGTMNTRTYFLAVMATVPALAIAASDFAGTLTIEQERELAVFGMRGGLGLSVKVEDVKNRLSRPEIAQMVATGLNGNGHLCAEVAEIRPLKQLGTYG